MTPEDVVAQLCVNPRPMPFNAGYIADVCGCDLEEAERVAKTAAATGVALVTKDKPPEGRGAKTYIGVRSKALPYAKRRLEDKERESNAKSSG